MAKIKTYFVLRLSHIVACKSEGEIYSIKTALSVGFSKEKYDSERIYFSANMNGRVFNKTFLFYHSPTEIKATNFEMTASGNSLFFI